MKNLSKKEIKSLFDENKDNLSTYKKSGTFGYRHAIPGETVITMVSGKLETIKKAGKEEVVVRNLTVGSSAEFYIIGLDKFVSRYDVKPNVDNLLIDGQQWILAEANGKIKAFQYKGETISFKAPWDEEMICEEGDFIASPLGGSPDDIYRIEKETFELTYKKGN